MIAEPGAPAAHASATAPASASPQKKVKRRLGMHPGSSKPACRINAAADGTENQWVKSCSATRREQSNVVFSGALYRHAPEVQARNRSWTDMSNVRSAI